MKQIENRLSKLEKATKLKPCVWVFVPESDYPDRDEIDTDELRQIAEKKFGITNFYLSAFTSSEVTEPRFQVIEDFKAYLEELGGGKRIGEK
ncbi:MAG: hypothetical protein AAED33_03155 [Paracoccaceae bacterium]|jgi:hypothetical protein